MTWGLRVLGCGIKIIPRIYDSGRRAWQVLMPRVNGKRKQPCFKTREKAEAFLAA